MKWVAHGQWRSFCWREGEERKAPRKIIEKKKQKKIGMKIPEGSRELHPNLAHISVELHWVYMYTLYQMQKVHYLASPENASLKRVIVTFWLCNTMEIMGLDVGLEDRFFSWASGSERCVFVRCDGFRWRLNTTINPIVAILYQFQLMDSFSSF